MDLDDPGADLRAELKSELQLLLAEPSAPPRPLDDITGRAHRHRVRRRRNLAALATFVLIATAWGATRLDRAESTVELKPANATDATDPADADPTTTVTTGPATVGPSTSEVPAEPVKTSTIEDTAIGTDAGAGAGSVEYAGGSWTRCGGCDIPTDDSSYYYGYEAGQSYTVRFTGVQLQVFAPDDLHGGVAEVTVDGDAAATPTVDFLDDDPANRLVWDSGRLDDGDHAVTFTVRPGDTEVVLFDRADVYTLPDGPAVTPTAPPPGPGPGPGTGGGGAALLGAGVHDPYELAGWLGRPVDVWETWQGHSWGEMEGIPTVHQYMTGEGPAPFDRRWTGRISIGQPMWAAGESAATCNSGANDAHMANVARAIADAGFGDAYVRLGWEMDGYWFGEINGAWQDPDGWVACWRRWHGILKGVSPAFQLVWNPNFSSNTGAGDFDVRTVWPGDAFVDAAGPDYYDWNLDPDGTGFSGAPVGINRWIDFVVDQHHKPFAMPEWGLNAPNGGGDDPGFIDQVFDALDRLKADGHLAYASYFNLDGCVFQIHLDGCNPRSGDAYRSRAQAF
ncbi:MAG TPA: hypothetical protein VGO78_20500 [Acidimicrobiales bacterium]|nr:hypothetical protein [Acidimicrobiales bacterium]